MTRPVILAAFLGILSLSCSSAGPIPLGPILNIYDTSQWRTLNSGIAQGSIFNLFGLGLAESTASQGVPLRTDLAGVSITVTVGGVTTQAIPYFVSPDRITAILPSNTPVGLGKITVTSAGQPGSSPFNVVGSAFALAAFGEGGIAVAQNDSQAGELLSQTNAANPGEYLTLWGSGLGPVAADETQYQTPNNLKNVPIEVDIGGVSATVTYHGRSVYPGVDQINVIVPAGVSGCKVSVVVTSGGVPSNFATIQVATSGRMCSDPELAPITPEEYRKLLDLDNVNVGTLSLMKFATTNPRNGDVTGDRAFATFRQYTAQQFSSSVFLQRPSTGGCLVTYSGEPPFMLWGEASLLNAGSQINVTGPNGLLALAPSYPGGQGIYVEPDGAPPPIVPSDGGTFTFDNGSGGPDVGAFTTSFSEPLTEARFLWTNRPAITAVERANGQPVKWTGGLAGSHVHIFGYSSVHVLGRVNNGFDVYAYFTCTAPVSAGQFTVPAAVLKSLFPATSGYLYVANETIQRFSAPGLDLGVVLFGAGSGISIPFN